MKLASGLLPRTALVSALLSCSTVAFGQFGGGATPPTAPTQKPGDDPTAGPDDKGEGENSGAPDQNSPFNNPEMRLRMLRTQVSGLGGFGGRGGPGGGNDTFDAMIQILQSNPALQEEVKLTPEQKEEIDKARETNRTAQRDMFRQLMSNQNGGGNNGGGGGRGRGQLTPELMAQMGQAREQMAAQTQTVYSKILSKAQISRLGEIRLRIIGPLAVAEPAIAQKLRMSELQATKIQQIMDQMTQAEREMMQEQFAQFRGGNGNPPNGQPGDAAPGNPQDNGNARPPARGTQPAGGGRPPQDGANPDDNQRRQRFDPNSPEFAEMRGRIEEGMSRQEELRKKAEAAVAKILSKSQKSTFNKMLGDDYDLAKLAEAMPANTNRGGRGGRGGGRGGN